MRKVRGEASDYTLMALRFVRIYIHTEINLFNF